MNGFRTLPGRLVPPALVAAVSAWMAFGVGSTGDYPDDAAAPIHDLATGHLGALLSTDMVMGPLSIIFRAPFAALGDGSELSMYQWGSIPCLMVAGLLGLHLARVAARRGAGWPTQVVIAAVCLYNPLTLEALRAGHPEEILTAALAVWAVSAAAESRNTRAAILLGLAIACKQWAIIAVFPVLMALPGRRLRTLAATAGVAAALILPAFVAHPAGFVDQQTNAASSTRVVGVMNVWYPAATTSARHVEYTNGSLDIQVRQIPSAIAGSSHTAIVLLCLLLPLLLAWRRGTFSLGGSEAMALLALLSLVRCALDPFDNVYYHLPLLMALLAWDALDVRQVVPVRALALVAVAYLWSHWALGELDPGSLNLFYLGAAAGAALSIGGFLFRRGAPAGVRPSGSRDARPLPRAVGA